MNSMLPCAALIVAAAAFPAQAQDQRFGAVVVYADPIEAGAPAGEAFEGPSEAQVLEIAIDSCKANTVTDQWGNCAPGRWIGTGRSLLVASVCDAVDDNGDPHRILFFLKDGVAASDAEIALQAGLQINHGTVSGDGCRKVAVYDATKPARTEPEDSLVMRSVAKDMRSVAKDKVK